jgi:hypothetical protein
MSFIGEGLLTTVVKYNGTAWVTVGNAGFSAPSFAPSLSVYNGTPYVAFADANTSDSLASVMKCDGSSWTYVGNKGFSVDTANNMFLNIFNGIPYVIFEDSGNIVWVMKYQ